MAAAIPRPATLVIAELGFARGVGAAKSLSVLEINAFRKNAAAFPARQLRAPFCQLTVPAPVGSSN